MFDETGTVRLSSLSCRWSPSSSGFSELANDPFDTSPLLEAFSGYFPVATDMSFLSVVATFTFLSITLCRDIIFVLLVFLILLNTVIVFLESLNVILHVDFVLVLLKLFLFVIVAVTFVRLSSTAASSFIRRGCICCYNRGGCQISSGWR